MKLNELFLELHFTDLLGYLRIITHIVRSEEEIPQIKAFFDGSSVYGFASIEDSDTELRVVTGKINRIPWRESTYRAICQVYKDGKRLIFDPRYIAEKTEEYLKELGYRSVWGPEVEFFIFKNIDVTFNPPFKISLEISSIEDKFVKLKGGYFITPPFDSVIELRNEICKILNEYFGIKTKRHHHEVASRGQGEITFEQGDLVDTADNVQTLKYVVKNVAKIHGFTACFMPKPIAGDNGSGMHIHVNLTDLKGNNLFYDPNDEYACLSQLGRYFIGGLLEHARSLSAIVSPTVNSYRRLIPGFEAPVYLVWGKANRSAAIRVPAVRDKSIRVEYRPPDPTANPYLAFAAIVLAGLDGIKKKIDPGPPLNENVYHIDERTRKRLGIKTLPRSLEEALDELECDHEYLKPVFPTEVIEKYIELKRHEVRTLKQYPAVSEFYYYLTL